MSAATKELKPQKTEAGAAVELAKDLPVFSPATDIYERDDAILVVCDMPGVDAEHVEVTLEDDVLTLSGEQQTRAPEGYDCLYRGYEPGVFRRSFRLATPVDRDRISAKLRNGVLQVLLPKAAEAQPKKIKVETS